MILRKLYYCFELKRHQHYSPNRLKKIQEKRLRKIIKHAYENVPFYRTLFNKAGVKPKDIKTIKDLTKLHIITKKDIQKNYPKRMLAKGVELKDCVIASTSGSTGIPLKIAMSKKTNDYSHGLMLYALNELGVGFLDSYADFEFPEKPKTFWKKILTHAKKSIDVKKPVKENAKRLQRLKPVALYGRPSSIFLTAQEIKRQGIKDIKPRAVLYHGENMTAPMRRVITEVFVKDVNNIFSLYGSAEFYRVAFECKKHKGLHLITDGYVVEFVDQKGNLVPDGKPGQLVITSLYNYEMPLIRYNIGDISASTKQKCSCGRNWPLMKHIDGRSDDMFILPSGNWVSARNLTIFGSWSKIKNYKVIQEKKDKVKVLVVPDKGFKKSLIPKIKKEVIKGCQSEKINVDVKLVKDIPIEKDKKFRFVISKVKR